MTEQHAIYDEVSALLIKLFEIEPDAITPEARLYEDLELDSIDAVIWLYICKRRPAKKLSLKSSKPCAPCRTWWTR